MLMSPATGQNSDYMVNASPKIKEIRNFFMLFCLFSAKFISPKARKWSFRCFVRTNSKAILLKILVKTDSPQWTHVIECSAEFVKQGMEQCIIFDFSFFSVTYLGNNLSHFYW